MPQSRCGKEGEVVLEVIYENNKKTAYFNGVRYHLERKSGYYLHSASKGNENIRLHRAVYEYYNGKIPKGYQIHHIDHDKSNNDISNLIMLSKKEHLDRHKEEMTEEEKEKRRKNVIKNAIPKAREHNLKNRDKDYYKNLYEISKDKLHENKSFTCLQCNNVFKGIYNGNNKFCSNKCKSKYRRKMGLDNEERICPICKKIFSANKYQKTVCCSRSCANSYRNNNK